MKPPASPPRSICVLRLSAIGDVSNAVAAVQAIQRAYPEARLVWIIGAIEHQLLHDLPGVEFIVFDKRRGARAYADVRRQLAEPFDVLLHMQLSLRANLLALLVPARRKIGFPRHLSKELHSVAVSERVALDDDPHVLEGFQAFARALGVPKCPPTWSIPIPAEDATWARDLYPEDARVLVICPAASAPERSWLAERYAAVADHAAAAGWSVVLTGGPSDCERQLAAAVQSHASQPIANLVGKTSLKALLALLQRADLLLAPDTGPAHMAVSQGTPVIGLYAHSNPARTGPYLFRDEVVSAYEQHVTAQQGKPLAAIKWGTRAKGDNLMTSIGVDEVIQAFDRVSEKLLAAGSTPARP